MASKVAFIQPKNTHNKYEQKKKSLLLKNQFLVLHILPSAIPNKWPQDIFSIESDQNILMEILNNSCTYYRPSIRVLRH